MIINHNMASLNTYNKLSTNNSNSSKALEKLSSGLRINRAGDDAAGLAISEKMRGQIRGLDQASRNAQDATSMLNTAEGNLSETHSILQRMKELATQAANDTNVGVDRNEIQKEINQLTSEINRIGNTTEFNTQKLLNGGGSVATSLSVTTTTEGGAAGKVSAINTLSSSKTGKALATIQVTSTDVFKLNIEAQSVGTDLNGWTFTIDATTNASAGTSSVTKSGATALTLALDVTTGINAAQIQSLINNSGLVTDPVNVTLTDATTGAQVAGNLGGSFSAALTSSAAIGGDTAETRGVYTFDVQNAFVNAADKFVLRLPDANTPDSFADITLVATTTAFTDDVNGFAGFAIGTAADRFDVNTQANNIKNALASLTAVSNLYDVGVSNGKITLTEKTAQTQGMGMTLQSTTSQAVQGVMTYTHSTQNIVQTGGKFNIDGVDINVVDGSGANDAADVAAGKAVIYATTDTYSAQITKLTTAITNNSQLNAKYSAAGNGAGVLTLTQTAGNEKADAAVLTGYSKAGNGFEAKFQVGANTAQSMTIQINDMRAKALEVSGITAGGSITASNGAVATFKSTKEVTDGTNNTSVEYALDVSSHDKATAAISVIEDAIESVSAERSKIGAYTNRLEHTVANLTTSSENLTAAESRIRDVDMAKEMMNFQKNNILSQAAQAMLAQANQQPQGVLQLLR